MNRTKLNKPFKLVPLKRQLTWSNAHYFDTAQAHNFHNVLCSDIDKRQMLIYVIAGIQDQLLIFAKTLNCLVDQGLAARETPRLLSMSTTGLYIPAQAATIDNAQSITSGLGLGNRSNSRST